MANTVFSYDTTVRITGTFEVSGAVTDPTTITLEIKTPSNVVTSYTYAAGTVTKSSTGIFYEDVQLTEAGVWEYRWEGTGACAVTDLNKFEAEAEW